MKNYIDIMKVLVFGVGWIGEQFIFNTKHTVVIANTRPENFDEAFEEIHKIDPDCVISFLGRTHGTIDGKIIPW